jgi:hypothetical protein
VSQSQYHLVRVLSSTMFNVRAAVMISELSMYLFMDFSALTAPRLRRC